MGQDYVQTGRDGAVDAVAPTQDELLQSFIDALPEDDTYDGPGAYTRLMLSEALGVSRKRVARRMDIAVEEGTHVQVYAWLPDVNGRPQRQMAWVERSVYDAWLSEQG